MRNRLGKGILIIFATNIINMIFSLITNFVLPKYLSYETYALIKTFQLYVSYVGLFHLGYSDGMYLHYGGKELEQIDKDKLSQSLSTMRIFQFVVSLVVGVFSLFTRNWLLLIFAFDIFSYNLMGYFKNLFQAVGEFRRYAQITNIVTIFNFVLNVTLICVLKSDNPYLYVLCYTMVDMFAWMLLELKTCRSFKIELRFIKFSSKEFIWNIRDGILLLFGNLTSILITSIDRWFTKILLTITDFAQYSFAVSVENFLNIAITPVTITLYNYLCKNPDDKEIRKLKNQITLFATALVTAFFPVKFILEVYLHKYINAARVIAFLFASQMFYVVIKSIYVNLYKARMQQKRYFIEVLVVITMGFCFNVLLFTLSKVKESFAVGTLLSSIVWFIICQIDFKDLRPNVRELFYQIVELVLFLTCAMFLKSLIGLIVYVIVTLGVSAVFMRDEFKISLKLVIDLLRSLLKKV